MMHCKAVWRLLWAVPRVFLLVAALSLAGPVHALQLEPGDRIVIMGNGFAEGMYRHGWLEAAIQAGHTGQQLRVRNMGWSGDTPTLQPRELNFGTMTGHLAAEQADVIIASWGMNESFGGEAALAGFEAGLRAWITDMRGSRFNGDSAPRIALLSPIAHEDLGPPLPSGKAHNIELARYTDTMRRVCSELGIEFVDLFRPSMAYYSAGHERPLTRNGIHPTGYGYWFLTREIVRQLRLPLAQGANADTTAITALRKAIWDKNWHFFLYWRPVNMEYIRGRRREPFGIEDYPREFSLLRDMVEERDTIIWDKAQAVRGNLWYTAPGPVEIWEQVPAAGYHKGTTP